jgi:hypothetical protein
MSSIGSVTSGNTTRAGGQQQNPIAELEQLARSPLKLFQGDSLARGAMPGRPALLGAPPMPGGTSIEDLLASLAGKDKDKSFDVSSVADVSTNMGRGGSSRSGSSEGAGEAGGVGGAGGAGGLGNMLQGIMGLVGQLLPLLTGFL